MGKNRNLLLVGGGLILAVLIVAWLLAGISAALALLVWFAIAGVYITLSVLVGRAADRKGRSETTWFLLALIFGIVLPAIIVAIMAPVAPVALLEDFDMDEDIKICPFCAEKIRVEAKKCKHCGEFLVS